tara:strand:+ start:288 stop:917 length:630 start_codon:yes stop_codon:yes gene_type:complete
MGLFDDLENEKKKNLLRPNTKTIDPEEKESTILQAGELVSIVRKVIDLNMLDAKAKKQFKDYRSRLRDAKWQLHNALGTTTPSNYAWSIAKCLEAMEKNILQSQPNGEWKVLDYDVDIRKDNGGDECVMLVVKFVDVTDSEDLQYQNGQPAMNINIRNGGLGKDVMEALKSKGDSSDDGELKDLLKNLIAVMAQNTAANNESGKDTASE